MKNKIVITLLLFLFLAGLGIIFAPPTKAVCCIDDCYEGFPPQSTGECCDFDYDCMPDPGGTPPPGGGVDQCAAYPGTSWSCVGEGGDRYCVCCPNGTTLQSGVSYQTGCIGVPLYEACSGVRLGSAYCYTVYDPVEDVDVIYWNHTCLGYACVASCSATAPSNLSFSQDTQVLSWTSGTGGSSERLYVSADPNQISNNCTLLTSPGCVVNNTNASSPYSLSGVISPGTVYYAKVVNYAGDSCTASTSTLTFLSSCSFSNPVVNVTQGDSQAVSSTINSSSAITSVTYTSADPGIASATSPDNSYAYSTTVGGVSVGSTTLSASVYAGVQMICSDDAIVNVLTPDPWWQVIDGDITSSGNLVSSVPSGEVFDQAGTGGYPGVPVYASTSDFGNGTVSDTSWIAESSTNLTRIYDFSFFERQVPEDTIINTLTQADIAGSVLETEGTISSDGYYWFLFDGTTGSTFNQDLTISSDVDLGSRKVILLVKGADLNIAGSINLTDGAGFFLSAVDQAINVDPSVGGGIFDLEGTFISDGAFSTGTLGAGLDETLSVRGSVASYGGFSLLRDIALNQTTPAEKFEYAPDQILLFPSKLGIRRIHWKEVAP